jgi:hypothetical protein
VKLVLSLIAFAILDLALAGFRAAAGRSARVKKLGYFLKAMIVGGVVGAIVSAILAGCTFALLGALPDGRAIYENLLSIGARMWVAFVVFFALIAVALATYGIARHEVRTLASTVILGPFTLARPLVIGVGMVWGISASESWMATLVAIASCASVLGAGSLLERNYPNEAERLLARAISEGRGPESFRRPPRSTANQR